MEAFLLVGIAVLFVTGVVTAQGRDVLFVRETAREAAGRRACAARLEALLADRTAVVEGSRSVPLPAAGADALLRGAVAEETVEEVEPGLFAVTVRVTWTLAGGEPCSTGLRTLVAAGGER